MPNDERNNERDDTSRIISRINGLLPELHKLRAIWIIPQANSVPFHDCSAGTPLERARAAGIEAEITCLLRTLPLSVGRDVLRGGSSFWLHYLRPGDRAERAEDFLAPVSHVLFPASEEEADDQARFLTAAGRWRWRKLVDLYGADEVRRAFEFHVSCDGGALEGKYRAWCLRNNHTPPGHTTN